MSDKELTDGRLRERLRAQDVLAGTFIKTPTVHATEILGHLGFDFAIIDTEHAPFSRETIDNIMLAARASGIAAIVRVPSADHTAMLSALDCGATGVLVPHVTSPELARSIVSACRFRGGNRGFSNSTRAGDYGGTGMWDYVDRCDSLTTIIAMIEDPEAVEIVDEIVDVDGLDAVFIGRGDLMVAYQAKSPADERLREATVKVVQAAKSAGKAVLTVSPGGKDAEWLRSIGVTGIVVASDQGFMRKAAAAVLAEVRGLE